MAARHRQLSLTESIVTSALDVLATRLQGRSFANRAQLGAALAVPGLLLPGDALFGQQVGPVLVLCGTPRPDLLGAGGRDWAPVRTSRGGGGTDAGP